MQEWIRDNDALLWWLAAASVVVFVGTLVAMPFVVSLIPENYFTRDRRGGGPWRARHPAVRWSLIVLKNLLGVVFLLAGLAMLALPGQGLLAMLVGVVLLDFPGKFRLERWVIGRAPVRRGVNWLRQKRGRPPLLIEIRAPRESGAGDIESASRRSGPNDA